MKISMTKQSAFEQEIAALIVEHLNIEDIRADEIDPDAALFNDGLGLDSIDALELALAVSQTYGVHLRSNNERNSEIFASLRTFSAHIEESRRTSVG